MLCKNADRAYVEYMILADSCIFSRFSLKFLVFWNVLYLEVRVKKLIFLLIAAIFLAVSCGGSKNSESNDADLLPDEDCEEDCDSEEYEDHSDTYDDYGDSEETMEPGWEPEPEEGSPCENFAYTNGMIFYHRDGSFECGCIEGYFWGYLGCKRITFANICTGQTTCYDWYNYTHKCDEAGNLSGQDPYYARNGVCKQQEFSHKLYYNDETSEVDENLKLEWMNKAGSLYTWEDAKKFCENLKYGGKEDWRLPLPRELMISGSDESIHKTVFLWSSVSLGDDQAWFLDEEHDMVLRDKTETAYVRCVRGEPESGGLPFSMSPRFKTVGMNNVEIVRDLESGIIWQKNISKNFDWSDSMVYCEHSDYAGFTDWRLPNINELSSLVDYENGSVEFPIVTTILGPYFWSSTTNEYASSLPAHTLDFTSGENISLTRQQYYNAGHAFCIRNDPCREGWWWNGKKCAKSPCDSKPCEKVKHSDGTCGTDDFETYYCGCADGYFWNGEKCVDPCSGNPCSKYEHATKDCKTISDSIYICGCEENYYWRGTKKGCLAKRPEPANICTGQTHCYDMEKKIKCPAEGEDFYGQDAQYAALETCIPKNYKLNDSVENEPTVYDFNTDLEWQGKVHTRDYWSWNLVKNYCNNLNYAGYDDWRLPTFEELRTILDFEVSPLVSAEYFPDTPQEFFWTSSFASPENVYYVDFEDAFLRTLYLDSYYGGYDNLWPSDVRCVRGETYVPEPPHLTEIKSGEEDNLYGNSATGLLWKKIIMDKSEKTTWLDRLARCENLVSDGLSNWRLPNFNELLSISLDGYYIRFGSASTTNPMNPERNFGEGYIKDFYEYYLVCITENPCEDGEIWDGEKCIADKCRHDVCATAENSFKTCIPGEEDDPGYSCSCYENYRWDSGSQKCVADEKPDETSDADTAETPDSDGI